LRPIKVDEPIDIEREFEHLFKLYFVPLTNFIYTYLRNMDDSKEVVQNMFLKVWAHRDQLKIEGSIKGYLYQAAKNMMLDYVRTNKKHQFNDELDMAKLDQIKADTSNPLDPHLIRYSIAEAARTLKPKTQQIFHLWSMEGLTYEEIAQYMKISKRTVEYNMAIANDLVKDKLKKYEVFFDD
jgi:RNA polymerase sigma-70 factor, ECF subfamily